MSCPLPENVRHASHFATAVNRRAAAPSRAANGCALAAWRWADYPFRRCSGRERSGLRFRTVRRGARVRQGEVGHRHVSRGGPPQHDTWDPKPEAQAEIRGGFGTIATKTPGLSVGELMPGRPADRPDRRAAGDGDGRQCPLIERLPDDDGHAPRAAQRRKRDAQAAEPRSELGLDSQVLRQNAKARSRRPSRFRTGLRIPGNSCGRDRSAAFSGRSTIRGC